MLSSSVIKNVGQASHYYSQQDNYYTREEGLEQSEWWGKGAEKLELSGNVDAKQFTELLSGKLPNGEQLGKKVDDKIQHRPGWDLTFSAPKSVSILALIGGDKRLLEAHRQAVSTALSHIERGCGQARIKTAEGMTYQNTYNLIVALFHHDLSRAKDPQLHTHGVVMNMTQRLDGKWRSLASQMGSYNEDARREINGFIERVRHFNRYYSKLYETELAFKIRELGYEIRTDTKTGIFEIEGISDEAIKQFSKRREQIKQQLEEKGLSGGKAAQIATLNSRDVKDEVDRELLNEKWQIESKEIGLNCERLIAQSKQTKTPTVIKENSDNNILGAIMHAAKSLSVFQSTFTLEEVITEAAGFAIRENIKVDALLHAVETQIRAGELLSLPNDKGKTVLMAKSTLDEESRVLTQFENNRSETALITATDLQKYTDKHQVTAEQHDHLKTVFGHERIVMIEGDAARDSLLEPIIQIAKSSKLNMMLLSPTLVGSKQLAQELKQNPQSLWEHIKAVFTDSTPHHASVMQFLSQAKENKLTHKPDVLIVENSHLLSTHQQANLFEWNNRHDTKLILLGNKATLLSQQRGISFQQLIDKGVPTVSMFSEEKGNIGRENSIRSVVDTMLNRIVEVKASDDRYYAMANHYSKLSDVERKQSWLITQSKQSVNDLNSAAHRVLSDEGKLGKSATVNILVPVFLPEGKGAIASSYQKGQMVRFNESYDSLKINRGEYLRVVEHHKAINSVVLENEKGKKIAWEPDKVAGKTQGKVELFNEIQREFSVNEILITHRSLKSKDIVKGERLYITSINSGMIKAKNGSGKTVTLDLHKLYHRHVDYGYAATPHAIAHEKPHTLIAELPTRSFQTDQRRFYQAVSQPQNVWVYTDNQQGLISHLENKTGDRLTAHSTFKEAQNLKNNLHSLYDILEKQMTARGYELGGLSKKSVEAVHYALHHLAEREAGFTHKDVMQVAMQHALGAITAKTLTEAMTAMEKSGIVLRGSRSDGTLWTTAEAVKTEREIIALCYQDKGKLEPIASDSLLEKYCDPEKLKPERIEAIKAITQSRDRVLAIQGHPGTGKTTMLATVADVLAAKNLLEKEGYELLGLAPTHTAVKELKERGITAQTLDSFINTVKRDLSFQSVKQDKLILVVDEASMVSNRKMLEILQIAHQMECRGVIPTGDTRQLASIEAGKSFQLVQQIAMTKELVDIRRQSDNAPQLKQAVKETIAYDFKAAFMTLKDSIIEVPMLVDKGTQPSDAMRIANRVERVSILVSDYFSFAKEERDNIQVITPGHDDRKLTNTLIRDGLKKEGSLVGQDQSFSVLTAKSMTKVERSHATNLDTGDVLRFGQRESSHIKGGEYFTIVAINKDHSLLTLRGETGNKVTWQIPTFDKKRLNSIEVFKREERALQVGDMIRWARSDKTNGLLATEAAKITAIEKDKITAELANKEKFTFDSNKDQFKHWDHGYAATVYAVQGKTKDIILAHMESFRGNLTNQPSFLVALTRAVNTFRLYTDDAKKLLKTVERNTGIKLSSLEVIGQFPKKINLKIQEKSLRATLGEAIKPVNKSVKNNAAKHEFDRYAIERIKEGLNKEAEKIATDILGHPKEKGGNYIKFGSRQGTLTLTIKGEKQGWFLMNPHEF